MNFIKILRYVISFIYLSMNSATWKNGSMFLLVVFGYLREFCIDTCKMCHVGEIR